jgi:hypothetical protein
LLRLLVTLQSRSMSGLHESPGMLANVTQLHVHPLSHKKRPDIILAWAVQVLEQYNEKPVELSRSSKALREKLDRLLKTPSWEELRKKIEVSTPHAFGAILSVPLPYLRVLFL